MKKMVKGRAGLFIGKSVFQIFLLFFAFFTGILASIEYNESHGVELKEMIMGRSPEIIEFGTFFTGFPIVVFLIILFMSYSLTRAYGVFAGVLAAAGGYFILSFFGFLLVIGALACGFMGSFAKHDYNY